jgi:Domain of unknown function (DUF4276)
VTEVFFVVEGPTEAEFIRTVLIEHLAADFRVYGREPKLVGRGPQRGGMVSYARLRDDLTRLMRQHRNVWFTTMIDAFRIPTDFPGFQASRGINDSVDRVVALEQAMLVDISTLSGSDRLIPYIQMHEFEALLFTDPHELDSRLTTSGAASKLAELLAIRGRYETPEHINQSPQNAPSKQLEALYGSSYRKTVSGPLVTQAIGLEKLRQECLRFDAWVTQLENLA